MLKHIETYIQRKRKMPDNMVKVIQNMTRPTLNNPTKPRKGDFKDKDTGDVDKDLYEMEIFTWKENWKHMKQRKKKYKENEANALALVYNQCLHELRTKLKGTTGYDTCKKDNNVFSLVTMIGGYCCQFDALSNEYVAIVAALKNLMYFFQKPSQTNSDHHEDFLAMVEVFKEYGGAGSLAHFPNMLKKELKVAKEENQNTGKATDQEQAKAKKVVREKFLAALMLSKVNCDKYGELKRSMAENYMTGTGEYPKSPEMVLPILNAYVPPPGWNRHAKQSRGGEEVAMFAQ